MKMNTRGKFAVPPFEWEQKTQIEKCRGDTQNHSNIAEDLRSGCTRFANYQTGKFDYLLIR